MALITLDELKNYLRVDTADDDGLIDTLLTTAEYLCADVARLTDEQWAAVDGDDTQTAYTAGELTHVREVMHVAVMYAAAYFYEHREDADHYELTMTLRSLLFAIREGAY